MRRPSCHHDDRDARAPALRRLAAGLLPLLLAACSGRDPWPLRGPDGARPNVLLITIDTLRADHLGAYGYAPPTSPAIDALAAEGVRFTKAFTPVPTTAPALAALVTGVHLDRHGVRDNAGQLPDELSTMGEAFAAAGYHTAGFYGNGAIRSGFGQGLSVWEPFAESFLFTDAVGAKRAVAWIERAPQPWFLWVHFMDPHGPYNSSPPALSAGLRYPDDPALARELAPGMSNAVHEMIPRYQVLPRARRVGDYVRRYDGEIIGTDAQVRRLRRALEARGLLARTLVVLTADHGESLGESDYFFQHGAELNEASLHVPLVLRHPGLPAGARVDAPASLVDVLPTLLSLVGLPPIAGLSGRDLTPLVFGATADERTLVAYNVAGARRVAVRRGPWKLVGRIPLDHTGASDARRLFRVTASNRDEPVALTDQPEVAEHLEADLKALGPLATPAATRKRRSEVSSEDRERLRALGYLN